MKNNIIGIIGAMDEEVNKLKAELTDVNVYKKASMDFYEGKLYDKDVVVVRSGIGKVNAAICTQILVDKYNVGCVINTGIAGSLDAKINIGDIVLSVDALQHDVDAVGFGYDLGVIPRMEESVFKADEELLKVADEACREVLSEINIFKGRVVSGDQFISDKVTKEKLVNTFSGMCTEMEGAAMAQVAYLNNIPFLVLRAISDKADGSANMDYSQFEKQAIVHNVRLLKKMAERL